MRKFKFIALIAVTVLMVSAISVSAKQFITGYDVNNNYKPVQVERGVHVSGISLYPAPVNSKTPQCTCPSDIFGGSTAGNISIGGTLGVTGVTTLSGATKAGTLTQGGGVRATSTISTAALLVAADFDTENMIDYTLNVSDATITLPASSTLSAFIPTAGNTRTIFVRNATTTAAMDLTVAGNTGTILKNATTTATISGDTDGDNYAKLEFIRKTNTDIGVLMTIYKD